MQTFPLVETSSDTGLRGLSSIFGVEVVLSVRCNIAGVKAFTEGATSSASLWLIS